MYIARISRAGEWVMRIDDEVRTFVSRREGHLPQQPRAWRFDQGGGGAAAISTSIEGAIASARKLLVEPAQLRRRKLSETFDRVEAI